MSADYQIILIFVLFIGLLGVGMTVPFAILLPECVTCAGQRIGALHGMGLTSWGSIDSYTLTSIPLFMLMAEILQRSGLSLRVYNGLSQLVRKCRAASCRPTSPAARCSPHQWLQRRDRRRHRHRRVAATESPRL